MVSLTPDPLLLLTPLPGLYFLIWMAARCSFHEIVRSGFFDNRESQTLVESLGTIIDSEYMQGDRLPLSCASPRIVLMRAVRCLGLET